MRYLYSLVLIVLLSGCKAFPPQSQFYSGPIPPMPADTAFLEGLRIVLDPGHGGEFSGAVGPGGLLEKDVNLDVALELCDLLSAGGAKVFLTREGDFRCGGEDGDPLVSDLVARRWMASELNPTLFVSIHHNGGPPGVNRVETYYKLGNEGASLDLARAIQRRLLECTGIEKNFIRAGNYRVMRENPAICVLLEPSYLTNKDIEHLLDDPATRKREAYFIFLGIVDYASRGIPIAEYLDPFVIDPLSTVAVRVGQDIVPDTIDVKMDYGYPAFYYERDTGIVYCRPSTPFPAGIHTISTFARNRGGNALWRGVSRFKVESQPRDAVCHPVSTIPLGQEVCLNAYLVDAFGNPVSGSIDISVEGGRLTEEYEPVDRRFYVVAGSPDFGVKLTWEGGEKAFSFKAVPAAGWRALFAANAVTGNPIAGCNINVAATYSGETNEEGYALIEVAEGDGVQLLADGYEEKVFKAEQSVGSSELVFMEPLHGGLLLGRKIFIDPQGTFTGASLAEIDDFWANLRSAQQLRGLLKRGGARCIMSLKAMTASEKLKAIEEHKPSIYLSIGRAPLPVIRYCPGSRDGEQLATLIAGSYPPSSKAEESADYLLMQTSMVAVEAFFSDSKDRSPQEEAGALFSGILEYFSRRANN